MNPIAQALSDLAGSLARLAIAVDQTPSPEPAAAPVAEPVKPAAAPVKLETVRAKLAELSHAGKREQVKELLTQFGASKLSDIDASRYRDLLAAAEKVAA